MPDFSTGSSAWQAGQRSRAFQLKRGARRLWKEIRRLASFDGARLDGVELVTSTAERLSRMERSEFALRSSVLSRNSRALIELHELFPAANAHPGEPALRIVEKRAANPDEYRFYRFVSGEQPEPKVAPKLYAASETGRRAKDGLRYVLLIEHLPRQGLPDFSTATAHRLADSIGDISALALPSTMGAKRASFMSERLLSRFIALVEATRPIGDAAPRRRLEGMREGCRQALAIQARELPWVPSHNDLHLNNVCTLPPDGANGRFVFIDWEAFGLNYAGADLHHVVRLGVLEPGHAAFFEALRQRCLERLSDMHRLDMRVADLGAHAYALRRAVRRAVLGRDTPEIRLALQIHDRLMRLLGFLAPAWAGGEYFEICVALL
jgi:hypothetical protein